MVHMHMLTVVHILETQIYFSNISSIKHDLHRNTRCALLSYKNVEFILYCLMLK
jgi:hypothetical protein